MKIDLDTLIYEAQYAFKRKNLFNDGKFTVKQFVDELRAIIQYNIDVDTEQNI